MPEDLDYDHRNILAKGIASNAVKNDNGSFSFDFSEKEIIPQLFEAKINPEKRKELEELFKPLNV